MDICLFWLGFSFMCYPYWYLNTIQSSTAVLLESQRWYIILFVHIDRVGNKLNKLEGYCTSRKARKVWVTILQNRNWGGCIRFLWFLWISLFVNLSSVLFPLPVNEFVKLISLFTFRFLWFLWISSQSEVERLKFLFI